MPGQPISICPIDVDLSPKSKANQTVLTPFSKKRWHQQYNA
jgi:hypothetical protein